jgi:hypothetical protein
MLSALLVQLFGRDVLDRLNRSGFDSNERIADATPEQLADEGGIPLALARRIVAVAAEAGAPLAPVRETTPAASPRPARRRRPARKQERASVPAQEAAPFVDDAGLVSWMGFASRGGFEPEASFSVADTILDIAPRPEPDPGAGTRPSPRQPAPPPAAMIPPEPPPVAPERETARPPYRATESLWSFGVFRGAAEPAPAVRQPLHGPEAEKDLHARGHARSAAGTRKEDRGTSAPSTPRRRSSDDH